MATATVTLHNFTGGKSITCHCWNHDGSRVALCPNNNDVQIYVKNGNDWKLEHTLSQHDSVVTGIDWAPKTNRIVTCSQDRNAYVWSFDETSNQWKPYLVILRINRAATSVKWSPLENKFAVSSGAKVVSICHYEEESEWWVSKHVKKHRSTVTHIAWHPNNQLLATASTDYKARIFSAAVREVDKKPEQSGWGPNKPFGELIAEFDCSSWVHAVAFSPSGNRLAWAGHDSSLNVAEVTPGHAQPTICTLKLKGLPLVDLMFLEETKIVGAGHDCQPYLFEATAPATWSLVKSFDEKPKTTAAVAGPNKFKQWENMVDRGTTDSASLATAVSTKHQNTITCIQPFKKAGTKVTEFSTSALDGCICWWKC